MAPMASEWVDMIFTKLSLVYGVRFKAAYNGQSPEAVKADWAHELRGVCAEAVNHALHNLDAEYPPNVLQFREMCRGYRPPMRNLIPSPGVVMSGKVRERLQAATRHFMADPPDPLSGARSLRAKERNGVHLTRAQREFWRQALAREMRQERGDEG